MTLLGVDFTEDYFDLVAEGNCHDGDEETKESLQFTQTFYKIIIIIII